MELELLTWQLEESFAERVVLTSAPMSLGVLKCGDSGPVTLDASEGASLLVGRAPECALRLMDQGVSRRHVEVFVLHGVPHVRSLRPGDVTDVLVNGSELSTEPRPLAHGDTLLLPGADGDYSLMWEAAATDDVTIVVRPGCDSCDLEGGGHSQRSESAPQPAKTRCPLPPYSHPSVA